MATRSEQARAKEQRKGARPSIRAGRSKPGVEPAERSREKEHAGRKATYAIEEPRAGRPTRKSTRKSANRSKPDASFNLREQLQKGSPEARARRSRAKTARPRGSASR
ncbi:MAG TPA: hypothetical protein VHB21_03470 [Minicystis sp.]|nr:hypothetical protein [Minicystis sp.]